MKTLGNIIWHFPFLGFVSAIWVFLIGSLLTITIVAAPIGLGLIQYSKFLFKPFSSAMVSKSDLNVEQNEAWKLYSTIVRILYFPFGLLSFIVGIFQVVGLFISLVGIPCAIVVAKSLGTYFNPVNMQCVPIAVQAELENRRAKADVEKYLG
jgi:uncharacterized membrane protein YccF (DUF307 family)